ncbi:hypothetical protein CRG98_041053 [Punica granatum]|uniref:Uncharacterized protein n=1 Tax=Punica granatum TaxID=22663 RepID=A0A2I0I4K4_PUNGR|nr:hypothetical protein CRG98_041053 [Punica granatum]
MDIAQRPRAQVTSPSHFVFTGSSNLVYGHQLKTMGSSFLAFSPHPHKLDKRNLPWTTTPLTSSSILTLLFRPHRLDERNSPRTTTPLMVSSILALSFRHHRLDKQNFSQTTTSLTDSSSTNDLVSDDDTAYGLEYPSSVTPSHMLKQHSPRMLTLLTSSSNLALSLRPIGSIYLASDVDTPHGFK